MDIVEEGSVPVYEGTQHPLGIGMTRPCGISGYKLAYFMVDQGDTLILIADLCCDS